MFTSIAETICKTNRVINYKPIMVWAMNDRLTKGGISTQMALFEKCGYGGVMVMPWGGLPYECMSDEWLDMVECIMLSAEEKNMEVWLWDDWIFPSGFAGGLVGQEDKHKSKQLKIAVDVVLENGEKFESVAPPRTITAGVLSIDKYNNSTGAFECIPVGTGETISYESSGRNRLVVINWEFVSCMRHTVRSHSRFLSRDEGCDIYTNDDEDAWSVDMLSRETTETYLASIHEKYWLRLSSYFGKPLRGFFYDEPHIPTFLPWTYGFEEEFQSRKGYDIRPYLVRMLIKHVFYDTATDLNDDDVKTARVDYNDVWTSMVAENFFGVIRNWCKEHKILSIGHQLSDQSLSALFSCMSGMFFKNLCL